jgi:prefoldin alpha subunit
MAEHNNHDNNHEGHEHGAECSHSLSPEESQAELQQRYADMQAIERQIKEMQAQAEAVNSQVFEMTSAIASVNEISKDDKPKEALIPVAGGVFAKGEIKDTKKLILSVGAGICVEKSAEETVRIIEARLDELKKYSEQLNIQMNELNNSALQIEAEVRALLNKMRGN